MEPIKMHRPRIDHSYAEMRYTYVFSCSEDPSHCFGDTVTAGNYVWNSQKLVYEDSKTSAESRVLHINMYSVGPDLTVSAAAVQ